MSRCAIPGMIIALALSVNPLHACVDSFGSYCTASSEGWKGDTMTFDGTVTADG